MMTFNNDKLYNLSALGICKHWKMAIILIKPKILVPTATPEQAILMYVVICHSNGYVSAAIFVVGGTFDSLVLPIIAHIDGSHYTY